MHEKNEWRQAGEQREAVVFVSQRSQFLNSNSWNIINLNLKVYDCRKTQPLCVQNVLR